ncbi:hypothetical protein, partial [Nocardiopsis salina]|uniref:hypothetical protein n=1 Tax=Nocardiopsis salina TaxID=245836 RepID=UPI001EF9E579
MEHYLIEDSDHARRCGADPHFLPFQSANNESMYRFARLPWVPCGEGRAVSKSGEVGIGAGH